MDKNTLVGFTLIGAVLIGLADKLSGGRGLNLCLFLVLGGYLTCVVNELSGNKVCSKLELVEYLTTEGVGSRVAGYISTACIELNGGIVIVSLVVDGLSGAACGSDQPPVKCKGITKRLISQSTKHDVLPTNIYVIYRYRFNFIPYSNVIGCNTYICVDVVV